MVNTDKEDYCDDPDKRHSINNILLKSSKNKILQSKIGSWVIFFTTSISGLVVDLSGALIDSIARESVYFDVDKLESIGWIASGRENIVEINRKTLTPLSYSLSDVNSKGFLIDLFL